MRKARVTVSDARATLVRRRVAAKREASERKIGSWPRTATALRFFEPMTAPLPVGQAPVITQNRGERQSVFAGQTDGGDSRQSIADIPADLSLRLVRIEPAP